MKTVFFQGAYDLLNVGHVRAFKLAKAQGDILVVGLNSDALIRWYKHREAIMPFAQRREILRSLRYIDKVIECHEPTALRYLQRLKADVYVLSEEWKVEQGAAIKWMEANGGKVVFSPRAANVYDSSGIRERVRGE